jgi:uncharacterized protein
MLARATAWFLLLSVAGLANAAEIIPRSPAPNYFVQYTNVVSPQTAARINETLQQFEKDTSSQILVAIFPRLPQNAALEDYSLRVAEAWKPGLKKTDNGAVLFIFMAERQMRIEVGYGLEGTLPDSLARRIIAEQITPRFRQGDYDGGVLAGVQGILQATRGEYKGTGRTRGGNNDGSGGWIFMVFLCAFILIFIMGLRRGRVYGGRGAYWGGGWGGWSGGAGGGGWSGGSSGGGFSGGGGSFGGGGASGSW